MKGFVVLFIFLLVGRAYAQPTLYAIKNTARSFELVSIDCTNDSVSVITPQFPSVITQFPLYFYTPNFSSCYSSNLIYYYCTGQVMYVVDVQTGAITDTFDFRFIFPNYLLHIVFNDKDGFIYGIFMNMRTNIEKFARFDPVNGVFLDTIPMAQQVGVGVGCKSVIDDEKQEYLIQSTNLAAIDIASGNVIYNNPIQNVSGQTLDHIAYSCKSQTIFGLSNDPHSAEEYFASVDSVTGLVHNIDISPLPVNYYKQYQSGCSVDNITDICYYPASGGIIYGIDIHTGNIVYNHSFGPGFDFLFLESASNYYCEIESVRNIDNNMEINIFPNPARNILGISKNSMETIKSISVLNSIGQKLIVNYSTVKNAEVIEIDVASLSSGIYFLEMLTGKQKVVKKFVKE